jgi:4-amino-4-deoxy-L-arabinose transferase-like glycosyltransferase
MAARSSLTTSTFVLLAALVTCIAASLRVQGLWLGLPYQTDIDEPMHVTPALRIVTLATPDHQWWYYPAFFYYLLAGTFGLMRTVLGLSQTVLQGEFPMYHLSARILVAAIGTLAVALIIPWASRALHSRSLGLVAGLCLAVSPVHVRESQRATSDVTAAALVWLVFLVTLSGYDRGSKRRLLAAGFFSGLAASTKWNAGAVAIVPLLALWILPDETVRSRFVASLKLSAIVLVGLLAGSPMLPFRLAEIRQCLGGVYGLYSNGNLVSTAPHAWPSFARLLATDVGGSGIALAAIGAFTLVAIGRRGTLLWLFPALYFVFVGSFRIDYQRTVLPMLPLVPLAVAAGFGRLTSGSRAAGLIATALLVLGLSAATYTTQRNHAALVQDKRTLLDAKTWAEMNLPEGASVLGEWHGPPLNEWPAARSFRFREVPCVAIEDVPVLAQRGVEYVVEAGMYEKIVANPDSLKAGTTAARVRGHFESLHRSARLLVTIGRVRIWELPRTRPESRSTH